MSNIRIEVKLGGARHMGRFLPYGNVDTNKSIGDIAMDYVMDSKHAEYYCFSAVKRGMGGKSAGVGGVVSAVVFTREQVAAAIARFNAGNDVPALKVHNGGVALARVQYIKLRQSFGVPVAEYAIDGLAKLDDIVPDASCPNAPYARAWEKLCAKAVNGKWTGGFRNVQFDIVVNEADD